MRVIPTATLAAFLIISMPATAQNSSQAAATATAATASSARPPKPANEEKKICKRIETSGSHMIERVCLTKEAQAL